MENNQGLHTLPMMAMKYIPTPGPEAKHIVALVKKGGRVEGYQLEDGQVLSKQEGVSLAKAGGIAGVGVSTRKGNEYLKSLPDGTEGNNLNHLPTVPDPRMN